MDPPPTTQPSASRTTQPTSSVKLEELDPSVPHHFIPPAKRINEGGDVTHFLTSKAYRDIGVFVLQLNRALCPRKTQPPAASGEPAPAQPPPRLAARSAGGHARTFTLNAQRQDAPSVQRLRELLDRVEAVVEEAPPDPGPRRFGNISFRRWHALLEERAESLLKEFVAPEVLGFGRGGEEGEDGPIVELKSYFLGAFGSSQRMDYGTGHEVSFLAFLGCLWKLGAFKDGGGDGEIERSIVLGVIERYAVCVPSSYAVN